jgi:hypothetical protein
LPAPRERRSCTLACPRILDFFGTPLVIEPSPGQLSGDAGLLPIRQFDERVGLTQSFAAALDDHRDSDLTEHTFLEMVPRLRHPGRLRGPTCADNDQFVMLSPSLSPNPRQSAHLNKRR